jgi:hypothetical protein
VPLSSIYSVSGSDITEYQVWFSWPEGGDPADGRLSANGTDALRIVSDTPYSGQPYAHLDWAMAVSHSQGALLPPVSISDVHGHGFLI